MSNPVHAQNCHCIKCGDPAAVFWPVIDPDIPSSPYCRPCVDKAKARLLVAICEDDRKRKTAQPEAAEEGDDPGLARFFDPCKK